MARKGQQITVTLKNTPNASSEVFNILETAGVNICGLYGYGSKTRAAYLLVVENKHKTAVSKLEQAGYSVELDDVLLVDLPHEPGAMARIASSLAEKGIAVNLAYVTSSSSMKKTLLVIDTSDNEKAKRLLRL